MFTTLQYVGLLTQAQRDRLWMMAIVDDLALMFYGFGDLFELWMPITIDDFWNPAYGGESEQTERPQGYAIGHFYIEFILKRQPLPLVPIRDRFIPGYLYSLESMPDINGRQKIVLTTGWKGAQEQYDRMIEQGFSEADILYFIKVLVGRGSYRLDQLTFTSNRA